MASDDTDHTVFVAQALLRSEGDPAHFETVLAVTQAGGDVDTVAAIVGALAGISVGPEGIPEAWRAGLVDWPHSLDYLRRLASALAGCDVPVNTAFSSWLFVRGVVFTAVILAHGFRRLLPPY